MAKYSEEFREQTARKMIPPNAMSVARISRDSGVSEQTLYNWQNRFRSQGKAVPADPSNPEHWSGGNKLAVVIETAALNEEALAKYCRHKGLYVEQIARWREAAIAGAGTQRPVSGAAAGTEEDPQAGGARIRPWLRQPHCWYCKKSPGHLEGQRGRLIVAEDRQMAIDLIEEAVAAGARHFKPCAVLEIDVRTLQRWKKAVQEENTLEDQRKAAAANRTPANKLSDKEREAILSVCNQPETGVCRRPKSCRGWRMLASTLPRNRASTGCCAKPTKSIGEVVRKRRAQWPNRKASRPLARTSYGAGTSPF